MNHYSPYYALLPTRFGFVRLAFFVQFGQISHGLWFLLGIIKGRGLAFYLDINSQQCETRLVLDAHLIDSFKVDF